MLRLAQNFSYLILEWRTGKTKSHMLSYNFKLEHLNSQQGKVYHTRPLVAEMDQWLVHFGPLPSVGLLCFLDLPRETEFKSVSQKNLEKPKTPSTNQKRKEEESREHNLCRKQTQVKQKPEWEAGTCALLIKQWHIIRQRGKKCREQVIKVQGQSQMASEHLGGFFVYFFYFYCILSY